MYNNIKMSNLLFDDISSNINIVKTNEIIKTRLCTECNKHISKTNWYTHIKTKKHENNIKKKDNDLLTIENKPLDDTKKDNIKTNLKDIRENLNLVIFNI